jgi:hypothetical protein
LTYTPAGSDPALYGEECPPPKDDSRELKTFYRDVRTTAIHSVRAAGIAASPWPYIRSLANSLRPYNLGPSILGEGSLTLWLLAMSVNVERWKEQTGPHGTQWAAYVARHQ